jgi:hypothetical protein
MCSINGSPPQPTEGLWLLGIVLGLAVVGLLNLLKPVCAKCSKRRWF